MLNLDLRQIQYSFITIAIELPVFWACGFRKFAFLGYFAFCNFISNVLLNETLPAYEPTFSYWVQLLIGESLVVILEYTMMRYVIAYEKLRLFTVICLTNAVSLILGLILILFL